MSHSRVDPATLAPAGYPEDYAAPGYDDDEDDEYADPYAAANFVPDAQTIQFMLSGMNMNGQGPQASARAKPAVEDADDEITLGHIVGHEKTDDEFARAFETNPDYSAFREVFKAADGMNMLKAAAKKGERVALLVPDNKSMERMKDQAFIKLKSPSRRNEAKNFIKAHATLDLPGVNAAARIVTAAAQARFEDDYYYDDDEVASAPIAHPSSATLQSSGARITVQRDPKASSKHAKVVARHASRERGGAILASAKVRSEHKFNDGSKILLISEPLIK